MMIVTEHAITISKKFLPKKSKEKNNKPTLLRLHDRDVSFKISTKYGSRYVGKKAMVSSLRDDVIIVHC